MLASLLNIIHFGTFGFLLSLLLVTAMHKISAPRKFQQTLASYDVLPQKLAVKLAKYVPWFEISIIVAAISAYALDQHSVSFVLLLSLFALYTSMIAKLVIKKQALVDCGCSLFNTNVEVPPSTLLKRNLGLITLCVIFYATGHQIAENSTEWLFGLAFSCFLFITYSSLDLLLENHVQLSTLRPNHD
jgi:hypothetical protein